MVVKEVIKTEKTLRLLNEERVITFLIDSRADKKQVKEYVENWLNVEVEKVRTLNRFKGKIAYVKLSPETNVESIASKLGLM